MRLPRILGSLSTSHAEAKTEFEQDLYNCNSSDSSPVVAYVAKMCAVPSNQLPEHRRKQLTAEELRERGRQKRDKLLLASKDSSLIDTSSDSNNEDQTIPISEDPNENGESQPKETFIGFARLYSGTIRVGQKLYVLGPKYNPAFPDLHCSEVTVESLYLMMGRELESLQEVPAGNVFGVGGLEGHILKNGTLSSTKECISLAGVVTEVSNVPLYKIYNYSNWL